MKRSPLLVGLAVVGGAVVLGFAAVGLYLASLGGFLPWQVDPTPISAGITPFAGLGGSTATPRATSGTPAAPGSTPVGPGASPVAFPAGTTAFGSSGGRRRSGTSSTSIRRRAGTNHGDRRNHAIAGEIGSTPPAFRSPVRPFRSICGRSRAIACVGDNDVKRFFLETDKYPIATFTVTGVEGLAGGLADGNPSRSRSSAI